MKWNVNRIPRLQSDVWVATAGMHYRTRASPAAQRLEAATTGWVRMPSPLPLTPRRLRLTRPAEARVPLAGRDLGDRRAVAGPGGAALVVDVQLVIQADATSAQYVGGGRPRPAITRGDSVTARHQNRPRLLGPRLFFNCAGDHVRTFEVGHVAGVGDDDNPSVRHRPC